LILVQNKNIDSPFKELVNPEGAIMVESGFILDSTRQIPVLYKGRGITSRGSKAVKAVLQRPVRRS
jgi:hypothetical protein